jgi:extradiol dioxygenase family protein
MFIFDPFGNALEFKSFDNQAEVFLCGLAPAGAVR